MRSNYSTPLLIIVFVSAIFLIYKVFFSSNTVEDHGNLHHQAHIALHDEKYEHVIEICNQVIEVDPSSPSTYHMYIKKAKALNKLAHYKEALDSADAAIAIDSKSEEGYSVKVEPLFHLRREEELTAVLEEIIVINPHTPLKAFLNCLRRDRDKAAY